MIGSLAWKPRSKGLRTDKNLTAETAESDPLPRQSGGQAEKESL